MLSLRSGGNVIVVAPEAGAGVVGWRNGCVPLLRRALPAAMLQGDPNAMGWFPMLPYANRMGLARFHWQGRSYGLERNFGDSPHCIHGIGWRRPWTVQDAVADRAALMLRHDPDACWPFAFQADIAYQVSDLAVSMTMAITNRHEAPAPAGLGLHPFFPRLHDPALRFAASGAWDNRPDALPLRHIAVPAAWNHAEPRLVAASRLDNCFTGWDGHAAISAGPASLRIEATEVFRNLQVFTPGWADFFCVEPMTHVPDALNRTDLPADQEMDVLAPGQTLRGTIRFLLAGDAEESASMRGRGAF